MDFFSGRRISFQAFIDGFTCIVCWIDEMLLGYFNFTENSGNIRCGKRRSFQLNRRIKRSNALFSEGPQSIHDKFYLKF